MTAPINHIDLKARVRGTKACLFPGFNRDVAVGRAMVWVLWQALAISTHVRSSQMKNVHAKALDASYLSLNIGNR